MRLYFQSGKHRLAIDTERKIWNNDYFYLGGYRNYINVKYSDMKDLLEEIDFSRWSFAADF